MVDFSATEAFYKKYESELDWGKIDNLLNVPLKYIEKHFDAIGGKEIRANYIRLSDQFIIDNQHKLDLGDLYIPTKQKLSYELIKILQKHPSWEDRIISHELTEDQLLELCDCKLVNTALDGKTYPSDRFLNLFSRYLDFTAYRVYSLMTVKQLTKHYKKVPVRVILNSGVSLELKCKLIDETPRSELTLLSAYLDLEIYNRYPELVDWDDLNHRRDLTYDFVQRHKDKLNLFTLQNNKAIDLTSLNKLLK